MKSLTLTQRYKDLIGLDVPVTSVNDLANGGYSTLKSIAIAPSPSDATFFANVMSEITSPGGEIYVAAREPQTAVEMANIFSQQFGQQIDFISVPRSLVPYESSYLEETAYVINFIVPGLP